MLTVGGRVLRVATRDGNPGRPPLLLCNGIGGRLELFQPVRRRAGSAAGRHPVRHARHRRVPGPGRALPPGHAGTDADRAARPARRRAGRRARHLLGRRARPAVRAEPAGPGAPPGTGRHRAGRAHGARAPESAAAHAHAAAPPRPGTRGPHRRRAVRRQPAGGPGPGPGAAGCHGAPRRGPGLLLPADLLHRLDQPSPAAQAAAARPDPGRGRRPDHPAGQRPDHAPADPAQPAARLSRRPPRARHRRRTPWHPSWRPSWIPASPPKGTGHDTGHEHPSRGGTRDGLLLRPRAVSPASNGEHFVTVRRGSSTRRYVPVIGPLLGTGRDTAGRWSRRLPELGIVGEDIKGYGCAADEPDGVRPCHPWNCTAATAAWAWSSACTRAWPWTSIAMCGSEEQKSPLAAGDGGMGLTRRVRAHRTRPRLGLGRPGNLGPPGLRQLGA